MIQTQITLSFTRNQDWGSENEKKKKTQTVCCSAKLNTSVDPKCWTVPGLHPITKTSARHWDLCSPGTFILVSSTDPPYAQKERKGSGLAEDGAGQEFFSNDEATKLFDFA